MRFWQNSRLDGTFEASLDDLDLDSAVRAFLTDGNGPVSAVWDDEADLLELCIRVRAAGWAGAVGETHSALA